MRRAYIKVWRDLATHFGRTVTVVMSIAVGVMALGMILSSNGLMQLQMGAAQLAARPAHALLFVGGALYDGVAEDVARVDGVVAADARVQRSIRWKPALDAEWQDADLVAVADFSAQRMDLVDLRTGSWPDARSIAVEQGHVAPFKVPAIGGTIYFDINDRSDAVTLSGTVRDNYRAKPPLGRNRPAFYVTLAGLKRITGSRTITQIGITVANFSEERARSVADAVSSKLEKQGIKVGFTEIQDPKEHWAQTMADGVGVVLTVMAVAALFLSVALVVNTINAILVQQVPQIGIMKTVGALRGQISSVYLAGVIVYGLLAVAVAVPLGALGGVLLSGYILRILNVPGSGYQLLPQIVAAQLATGLLVPLLAAIWPVLQGVGVSVREALSSYGVGQGRFGTRWLDQFLGSLRGLPRMVLLMLRNSVRRLERVALTQVVLVTAGAIFMMVLSTHYSFIETIAETWRAFGYDGYVVFEQPQLIPEVLDVLAARPGIERVEMWLWQSAQTTLPKIIQAVGAEKGPPAQMRGDRGGSVGGNSSGTGWRVGLRGVPLDTKMFKPKIVAGRGLQAGEQRSMLLNEKLAVEIGIGVGQNLELDLGNERKVTWHIVGLVSDITNNQETGYVVREELAREINSVGRATFAHITMSDQTAVGQRRLLADLSASLKARGMSVSSTRTSAGDREDTNAQFGILTTVLLTMSFAMALVGAIGLSGTLSINVMERRREIGVMRAVGASSSDVAYVFVGEGLLLGITSWLLAMPLSVLGGPPFVASISSAISFSGRYHLDLAGFWWWLLIVVVLSIVASWLPARRATEISVKDSLSYE